MKNYVLAAISCLFMSLSYSPIYIWGFTRPVYESISIRILYFGKITPYLGFQFISASYNYQDSGKEFDFNENTIVSYENTTEIKGSLLLPTIGAKFSFYQKDGLAAFADLNFSVPIVTGSLKIDGQTDDSFSDDLKNLNAFATSLSVGAEYFFNDNFSVYGSFGIRYARVNYNFEELRIVTDQNTQETEEYTYKQNMSFAVSPTVSRVGINFYF